MSSNYRPSKRAVNPTQSKADWMSNIDWLREREAAILSRIKDAESRNGRVSIRRCDRRARRDALLIFTTPSGRALDLKRIYGSTTKPGWFRRAAREAGLTDAITLHDLRHFFASLLIRNGASVKTVQARLGHKSATETLDTYGHLWPDADEQTRSILNGALSALRKADSKLSVLEQS